MKIFARNQDKAKILEILQVPLSLENVEETAKKNITRGAIIHARKGKAVLVHYAMKTYGE
jgi:hypothetical protein